jgi:hypothetical protein
MDYGYLDEISKRLNNPLTGKPYTFEEKAAENRTREDKLGIKDLTESELKLLKEKEDKLGAREDRAKGLGLLAASQGIMSSKGPGLGWMGAGLGAYGKTAGAELEKIDTLRENYAQQGSLLRGKQMDLKRAMLAGDTADVNRIEKEIQAIQIKQGEGANANIAAKDAARLKGTEAEYAYAQKMAEAELEGKYKVAAGAASNPSLIGLPNSIQNMVNERDTTIRTLQEDYKKNNLKYNNALEYAKGKEFSKLPISEQNIIIEGNKAMDEIAKGVHKGRNGLIERQLKQLPDSLPQDQIDAIFKPRLINPAGGGYGDLSKYENNSKDR